MLYLYLFVRRGLPRRYGSRVVSRNRPVNWGNREYQFAMKMTKVGFFNRFCSNLIIGAPLGVLPDHIATNWRHS